MSRDLPAMNVLGLMSGTSLDGIDAVLVKLERQASKLLWQIVTRASFHYAEDLYSRLNLALKPETSDVRLLTQLHAELGQRYAQVVREVQAQHPVDLLALSGQTVYHIPRRDQARDWQVPSSLQLGEAERVAKACQVPVISDFRQADIAVGGQGAPMVAFADLHLFSQSGKARAIHNLGGISNLSYLPKDQDADKVIAFDTGPANCLLDEVARRHFDLGYDAEGHLAAAGQVDSEVLNALLRHPYLALVPPKTTGREVFSLIEMENLYDFSQLVPVDLMATLTAFSAQSISLAYENYVVPEGLDEIVVAGGGALNKTLMHMIEERLAVNVTSFDALGWDAKDREALAFAVLAYFSFFGLDNTLPKATGAKRAVSAGKLSRP